MTTSQRPRRSGRSAGSSGRRRTLLAGSSGRRRTVLAGSSGRRRMPLAGSRGRRRRLLFRAAALGLVAGVAIPPVRRTAARIGGRLQRRITARIRVAAANRARSFAADSIDPLTGLLNRTSAEYTVADCLARASRQHQRLALLHVDVDDFAVVNDRFGDAAGDHVLQVCAVRMEGQIRATDHVARLADDNFLIVLQSAGPNAQLSRTAERVADALSQPITFEGETILITVSIGIAVAAGDQADPAELLLLADHAVGRARANGRRVMQS